MSWGLFEIISPEAIKKLIEYQYKHYHTKLDEPVMHFQEKTIAPTQYPSLEEIDRDMRKPIGEISPVKTKGIP